MEPCGVETQAYAMYVQIKTKTAEGSNSIRDIMHSWAPVMFKEEPNMHSKTVLGYNTPTTKGYPPMKVEECKTRVIMQWKSKADFAVHSDLPYMMPFKKDQMPFVASNFKDDLIVQHGPVWHIEKPGTAGLPCYTVLGSMVFSDLASAKKMCDVHKMTARDQLEFETEGAYRYTVFEPQPVQGTKEFVVINVAGFKDAACHIEHMQRKDPSRLVCLKAFGECMVKVVMDSKFPESGLLEFANSVHYD
jgi:hypothetical protein